MITTTPRKTPRGFITSLRSWNAKQPVWVRITAWALLLSLYVITTITLTSMSNQSIVISSAVLLIIGVMVVQAPYLLKNILATFSSVAITTLVSLSASVVAPLDEKIWVIVMFSGANAISIISTYTWFTYRPSGLTWLNLLWIPIVASFVPFFVYPLSLSLPLAVTLHFVTLIALLITRSIISKTNPVEALPKATNPLLIVDSLEKSGIKTVYLDNINVKNTSHNSMIFGVSKTQHLTAIYPVQVSQPLSFDKKGRVFYDGHDISGWLAAQMLSVKSYMPRGIPFVFLVAVDGDHTVNSRGYVPISIRERNSSRSQTILLVSSKKTGKIVDQVIQEFKPEALTRAELGKVTQKVQALK